MNELEQILVDRLARVLPTMALDQVIAYHGTRTTALQSIRDNGILSHPFKHYHPERFYKGKRGGSVYVTENPAIAAYWARSEVDDPSEATILQVCLPQDSLKPDEEAPEAERYEGNIPPEWIKATHTLLPDGKLGPPVPFHTEPPPVPDDAEHRYLVVHHPGGAADAEFDEHEHPRDQDGKFTEGSGVGHKSQYFKGHDVDAAFEEAENPASRYTIVHLSPSAFLDVAEIGHDDAKEKRVAEIFKEHGHFNTLPYLSIDEHGQVIGHEGRHRMRELRKHGVKEVPVILRSDNVRWGDPKYRDKIPDKLIAQGGTSISRMQDQVKEGLLDQEFVDKMVSGKTTRPMPDSVTFPREGKATDTEAPKHPDLVARPFSEPEPAAAVHFVGFPGYRESERYNNAVKVFGAPDFVHKVWDIRAQADIQPGDTVVFAKGDENTPPSAYTYDDSNQPDDPAAKERLEENNRKKPAKDGAWASPRFKPKTWASPRFEPVEDDYDDDTDDPDDDDLASDAGGWAMDREFHEEDHPRGQPDNAGKFTSGSGGGAAKAPEAKAEVTAKPAKAKTSVGTRQAEVKTHAPAGAPEAEEELTIKPPAESNIAPTPKKTVKAYKLLRTLKTKPGLLYPLFIHKTEGVEVGDSWYAAGNYPTPKFAKRPGWHAGALPAAPHLRTKKGRRRWDRVWVEVELPDDRDWQKEADKTLKEVKHKDKPSTYSGGDLPDTIPQGGHYRWKPPGKKLLMEDGSKAEWTISGAVRLVRILSNDEVRKILKEAGYHKSAEAESYEWPATPAKKKKAKKLPDSKVLDPGTPTLAPSGAPGGAETKLNETVVEVGGDQWNRDTAVKLEKQYQAAKPAMDAVLEAVVSAAKGKTRVSQYKDWADLPPGVQEKAARVFVGEHSVDYAGKQLDYWRRRELPKILADKIYHDYQDDGSHDVAVLLKPQYPDKDLDELAHIIDESITLAVPEAAQKLAFPYFIKWKQPAADVAKLGVAPEDVMAAFKKSMEIRGNIYKIAETKKYEISDQRSDDIKTYTGWEFANKRDEEKFKLAEDYNNNGSLSVTPDITTAEFPKKIHSLGDIGEGSHEDLVKTGKLAHAIQTRRSFELLKDRKLLGEGVTAETVADRISDLWAGWKNSSTSTLGVLMQQAAADELGAQFRTAYAGEVRDARNRLDPEAGTEKRLRLWDQVGGYDGIKALMRAQWETMQYLMDKGGVEEVDLYRGLAVPGIMEQVTAGGEAGAEYATFETYELLRDLASTKLDRETRARLQAEVARRDTARADAIEEVGDFQRLKNIELEKNGCVSTTMDRDVANDWKSGEPDSVTMRCRVPRTAVLSSPAFGLTIHKEQEVVILGTAWKGVDLWYHGAPSFEDVPLTKHQVAADAAPEKKPPVTKINIFDLEMETDAPHWLRHEDDEDEDEPAEDAEFKEEWVKRDKSGKFTSKGGGAGGAAPEAPAKTFGPIYHKTTSGISSLRDFDLSKADPNSVWGPAIYGSLEGGKWDAGHLKDGTVLEGHVKGDIIDLTKPLADADRERLGGLLGRKIDALPLLTLEKRYGSVAAGLKAAGYAAALHEGPGGTGTHIAVFDPASIVDAPGKAEPEHKITLATPDAELNTHFPRAGETVDGLTVRSHIPNTSSIDASVENSEVLPGVREVSMSWFSPEYKPTRDARTLDLAEQIKASGEINPLIVCIDREGAYIIEGGHRYDALMINGAKSLPALVVLDLDDLDDGPEEAAKRKPAAAKPARQYELTEGDLEARRRSTPGYRAPAKFSVFTPEIREEVKKLQGSMAKFMVPTVAKTTTIANTIAGHMGYDIQKLTIKNEPPPPSKLGPKYQTQGSSHSGTGEITFYPMTMSMADLPGLVAHEVMHQKWAKIAASLSAKDPRVMAALSPFVTGDAYVKLKEDDGATNYSTLYWTRRAEGKSSVILAIDETLAEASRLDFEGNLNKMTTRWQGFYAAVTKLY